MKCFRPYLKKVVLHTYILYILFGPEGLWMNLIYILRKIWNAQKLTIEGVSFKIHRFCLNIITGKSIYLVRVALQKNINKNTIITFFIWNVIANSWYASVWTKNKVRYILITDVLVKSNLLQTLTWWQNIENKLLRIGLIYFISFWSYRSGTKFIIKLGCCSWFSDSFCLVILVLKYSSLLEILSLRRRKIFLDGNPIVHVYQLFEWSQLSKYVNCLSVTVVCVSPFPECYSCLCFPIARVSQLFESTNCPSAPVVRVSQLSECLGCQCPSHQKESKLECPTC